MLRPAQVYQLFVQDALLVIIRYKTPGPLHTLPPRYELTIVHMNFLLLCHSSSLSCMQPGG